MVHVPYKGAAEQVTALISNEVQMSCIQVHGGADAGACRPPARAGRDRRATPRHRARGADHRRIGRARLRGRTSWQGVVVPAGTAPAIVKQLQTEIARALQASDVAQRLACRGHHRRAGITPEDFAVFIRSEIGKWGEGGENLRRARRLSMALHSRNDNVSKLSAALALVATALCVAAVGHHARCVRASVSHAPAASRGVGAARR